MIKDNPIIVALDMEDAVQAIAIAKKIAPVIDKVKVGMELYYSAGAEVVKALNDLGLKVFVDLKLHDIPNTAAGAARSLTRQNVWMWNVHTSGGLKMMQSAKAEAEAVSKLLKIKAPLLIGVTQLTSSDQDMLESLGITEKIEENVVRLAKLAKAAGLDGVVASAREVPAIKRACGNNFITVTPGIRLPDGNNHDQVRITTPEQAVKLGTNYMVIGRAITETDDPYIAAKNIASRLGG